MHNRALARSVRNQKVGHSSLSPRSRKFQLKESTVATVARNVADSRLVYAFDVPEAIHLTLKGFHPGCSPIPRCGSKETQTSASLSTPPRITVLPSQRAWNRRRLSHGRKRESSNQVSFTGRQDETLKFPHRSSVRCQKAAR